MTAGSELLLPDEMTLRGAGEALAARLEVEDGVAYERDRIYYDTFDGLLREAGLTLTHVDGDAVAGVAGLRDRRRLAPDAGADQAAVRARAAAGTAARHAAAAHRRPRAAAAGPAAQPRAVLSVLDGERKTVVRLALEETALLRSDGPDAALRPRLRITGIRGYDKDLQRVQEALVGELGFKPADQPLVDEAVRAAGGVPGRPPDQGRACRSSPISAPTALPRSCCAGCSR